MIKKFKHKRLKRLYQNGVRCRCLEPLKLSVTDAAKIMERIATALGVAFTLCATLPAAAQRAQVSGIVRNERGELLTSARVHATARGVDTTVRTNDRGHYALLLPMGTARVLVTAFGYEAFDREIAIDQLETKADFQLLGLARQIAEFAVRERWTGIRGVIGDEATREPLVGAEVMVAQAKQKVLTDSLGRFEIPLTSEDQTVVQVKRKGYQTRIRSFSVTEGQATDVVLLLKAGGDVNGRGYILRDLQQRLSLTPFRSFVAGRDQLAKNGAATVYDAIIASGLLIKNGLKFGDTVCLLVDGQPRSGFPISTVRIADIDFVEVFGYKADIGNSLRVAIGNSRCTTESALGPKVPKFEEKRYIEFVSVWTRK